MPIGASGSSSLEQLANASDIFDDVETAFDQPETADDATHLLEDDCESLLEVRAFARERFEWLTSRAPVAMARGSSSDTCGAGLGHWCAAFNSNNYCCHPGQQNQDANAEFQASVQECMQNRWPRPMPPDVPPVPQPGKTASRDSKMETASSYTSASKYLSACAKYSLTPNGGALLGLSLGLQMLEVDGALTNLELVPLCAALLDAQFVQHLKLSGHPLQDTGAAVLALALPGCPWISELELVGCKITGQGTTSICEALPKSRVRRLVLRGNFLRQNANLANAALAEVVEKAAVLTSLDLQSCGLTSQGMRLIKQAQRARIEHGYPPCRIDFEGNFVLVEVLNSVTHGACALVCLEAWRRLNALIIRLCHFESQFAVTLYIASMMCMFLGSTLYHAMFAVTDLSWFFVIIDHCAIYFLIAGTYTPVLVMGCRNEMTMRVEPEVSIWISVYWSLVILGIVMEHVFAPRRPGWYSKFILGMYVLMGFGGVPYVAMCPLVQTANVMVWIELGGLTYVIGIVFFLLDKRYPAMHVIWHILVGIGAFFHFIAVWNLTNEVLSDKRRVCPVSDSGVFALMGGHPGVNWNSSSMSQAEV